MSQRKPARRPARPKEKTAAQEALEVTWVLKGHLKNAQISYLRVGRLLTQVRDRQLYRALHHDSLESYAAERLHLGKTSLYRYLQVYEWARQFHPEWLEPKPKGFIPDLSDVADLVWIDCKLAEKDLLPATRTELMKLQAQALAGELRKGELDRIRRRKGTGAEGLKSFLSGLRQMRRRGAKLASLPPEIIGQLDAAIEILQNALAVQHAGLALVRVA